MKIINKNKCIILSILIFTLIFSFSYTYLLSRADEQTDENTNDYSSVLRDTSISVNEMGDLSISRNTRNEEKIMGKENTWTLFFYMVGSNLETDYECATSDIQEMLNANFTEENIKNVNVIIQTGGSKRWHSNRICNDRIERHKVDTNSMQLTNLSRTENRNMGDADTLYDFLDWGISTYPAEHMGIVFWNHGSGAYRGLCFDENYEDDSLSVHELEYTLAKLNKKMTSKFELIGFDTCLTGSLEYANILAPYAKYMVGSADVAIAKGWYYTDIINYLLENPDATGEELGKVTNSATAAFMDSYYERNPVNYTYATYDLSKVDKVCIETNNLSKYLYETLINNPDIYKTMYKFNNSRLTYEHNCVEIGSLLYYFENNNDLKYDTTNLRKALDDLIIQCNYQNKFDNEKSGIGITLYMPFDNSNVQQLNTYRNVCFSPYHLKYLEYMLARRINSDMTSFKTIPWEKSPFFFESNFDFINYDTEYIDDKNINDIAKSNLIKNEAYASDGFPNIWYNIFQKKDAKQTKNIFEKAPTKKDFTLSNGQILTSYVLAKNNTTTLYSFPVLINGKESSIRVEKTINANNETTYTTLGVWDASDSPYNNNKISRGYLPLKEHSIITPIYDVFDNTLNTYTIKYGEPFILEQNFELYINH